MNKTLRTVLLIFVVAFGIVAFIAYKYIYSPTTGFNDSSKLLYIPTGSTFDDVTKILVREKAIHDTKTFEWLADKKKYKNKIKPGCYKIKKGMTAAEIINLLRSGVQEPMNVKFNNLRTLPQLAAAIAAQLEVDSNELYATLTNDSVSKVYGFTSQNFISMFVPNTYQFYWNTNAEKFIQRMAKEYKNFWNGNRDTKAQALHLSHSEVVTLASIVQEETQMPTDKPIIAGVYLNRLSKNIPLEADPTLKFALQDFARKRILNADKEVVSPYNTYKNSGLPPGPICIPDVSTVDAVLNYTKHNYIFFCAREDFSGYSNFATTYTEHLVNARNYQAALDRLNIKR